MARTPHILTDRKQGKGNVDAHLAFLFRLSYSVWESCPCNGVNLLDLISLEMSSEIFPEMGVQGDPKSSHLDKDYHNNDNKARGISGE